MCLDLVDPDNRRPVDFALRRESMARLHRADVDRLAAHPCDGVIKLCITSRALRARKQHRELFAQGTYIPLTAVGTRANHIVAFARSLEGKTAIALAGRFFLRLFNSHPAPTGDVWGNTAIVIPKKIKHQSFKDALTGEILAVETRDNQTVIPLAKAFAHCPVALLINAEANGA